jgi:two-component system, NarL family, response regulator LiaR
MADIPHTISSRLLVCPVTKNCLAEAYLQSLLSKSRNVRPLHLKDYIRLSPSRRRNTVFVIDQCGLEVPFSECLKQLNEICLNPRFLVLDYEKSREEVVRLLVIGAHGYISHADAPRALVRAILFVAAGHLWVSPEALQDFLSQVGCVLRKDERARQSTTMREGEILELVRRRLSNREIADLLQIRVSTVKFHLSNILSKLQANSRHELTSPYARRLWETSSTRES